MQIIIKLFSLTLKARITNAADDIHEYFFLGFQRRFDVSSESTHEKLGLVFFER